jgi:arabinose-5-phosphate isomerase
MPVVKASTDLKDLIYEISSKRLGCTIVRDNSKILGIITDGDIRRLLEKGSNFDSLKAKDIMNKTPKIISEDTLAKNALEVMEKNKITQLIICDDKKKLCGIIHIHSLVELGL